MDKVTERVLLAQTIGWSLDHSLKSAYQGPIFLIPPSSFECSKHRWAATWKEYNVNGTDIMIPCWFWDDKVLLHGTRRQ